MQTKIQKAATNTLHSGSYEIIVFDMARGRIRHFNVNAKGTNKKNQLSNHVEITVQNHAAKKQLNQQVLDVKKAIAKIREVFSKSQQNIEKIAASSGFISAYTALNNTKAFNNHFENIINNNPKIISATNNAQSKIEQLSKALQIEAALLTQAVAYKEIDVTTKATFSDDTKITAYANIKYSTNKRLKIAIDTTTRAYNNLGSPTPKNQFDLSGYKYGGYGFDPEAFVNYFNSKGFTIVDKDKQLGKPNNCQAKWTCVNKICTLAKTKLNCQ